MNIEQKSLIDMMLRETFVPIVKTSVFNVYAKLIKKTVANLSKKGKDTWVVDRTSKYFNSCLEFIQYIRFLKTDTISEVLRQLGMHNTNESTYYHDYLSRAYEQCLIDLEILIRSDNYLEIYRIAGANVGYDIDR